MVQLTVHCWAHVSMVHCWDHMCHQHWLVQRLLVIELAHWLVLSTVVQMVPERALQLVHSMVTMMVHCLAMHCLAKYLVQQ